jgi:hypothetical protein
MTERLPLDSPRWTQLATFGGNAGDVPSLIRRIQAERSFTSESAFAEFVDRVFQQFSVREAVYAAVPHLVDLGETLPQDQSAELWVWIGTVAACAAVSEHPVPPEFADAYAEALATAEVHCVTALASGRLEVFEAYQIGVAALGLAGHRLGLLVMDNYSPEEDAETSAVCQACGKQIQVAAFDEGLVVEDQDFHGYPQPPTPPRAFNEATFLDTEVRSNSPWRQVEDALSRRVKPEGTTSLPASHISTAIKTARVGMPPNVAAGAAFSLLGSLLALNDGRTSARRYFHAWDEIECPFCGSRFVFADSWWGMKR